MKKAMYYMVGVIVILSICVGFQLRTTRWTIGKHRFGVRAYWIEPCDSEYRYTVWHKNPWYVWSDSYPDDLDKGKRHFVTLAGEKANYKGEFNQTASKYLRFKRGDYGSGNTIQQATRFYPSYIK